jgi:hypothetical protein
MKGCEKLFYEIEIKVGHRSDGHSLETTTYIKRFKLFYKSDLIEEAKIKTDSRIINQLNYYYKDCQFNFLEAYRKYGIVFKGTAKIRNRITGKIVTVYNVEWAKYHWNLSLHLYQSDKLSV